VPGRHPQHDPCQRPPSDKVPASMGRRSTFLDHRDRAELGAEDCEPMTVAAVLGR
jgi:hypothetical protein